MRAHGDDGNDDDGGGGGEEKEGGRGNSWSLELRKLRVMESGWMGELLRGLRGSVGMEGGGGGDDGGMVVMVGLSMFRLG